MHNKSNKPDFERWIAFARADPAPGRGDCVRIISTPDGRTLFFLGDVAGHDTRAADVASQLDARLAALSSVPPPGALLSILNAALAATWPPDLFMTAICFSVDPRSGDGSVAAAGQLAPIIRSPRSSRPIDVEGGPPLGVLADSSYAEGSFTLAASDLLVAVTDGVSDPLATDRDLLGRAALVRLVDQAPAAPADVCAALLRAAARAGLRDDATVLAVAPMFRWIALPTYPDDGSCLAA